MPLMLCLLVLTLTSVTLPQEWKDTEIIAGRIAERLERLDEQYLTKLNRRDYKRAKEVIDEIYLLLDELHHTPVYPVEEASFQKIKKALHDESFSSNRLDILKSAAGENNFSVHQVIEIIDIMTFSEDRIKAAEILYPWITDKQNSLLLFGAMKFNSEKEALKEIIERYK